MRILMSVTSWAGLSVQTALAEHSYPVTVADHGIGVFERLDRSGHRVVLLESGLPDMRWTVALGELRRSCPGMSVLVIDNADSAADRAKAFELGTDDVLSAEMPGAEIAARIAAVAARRAGYAGPVLHIGPLQVSLRERRVWWGAAAVLTSPQQYAILETLCLSAPDIVGKDAALNEICHLDPASDPAILDICMATLRNRLVRAGAPCNLIETVEGRGYRLVGIRTTEQAVRAVRVLKAVMSGSALSDCARLERGEFLR
jgi:DNA-binding response OmpR family regulator